MKKVLITLIPSPYIVTFCNEVYKKDGEHFTVIYCSRPSHMKWNTDNIIHNHLFLNSRYITVLKHSYLINISVWKKLRDINPDSIITCGFQTPMLFGMMFSLFRKRKLFIMSDTWALKERKLSFFHSFLRRVVYKNANGFFPVSIKGKTTFLNYGIDPMKIFVVPYVIDNTKFQIYNKVPFRERSYDIMFSGQFIDRKMPFFFVEVAGKLKKEKSNLKVLILGSGPLEMEFLGKLKEEQIDFDYFGFVQPSEIPSYYAKAKILLFTTREDSWGVVANEAIATSTPVIISEYAGAAGEIVIHEENGYVLPLNSNLWAEKTLELLDSPELYKKFQRNCVLINEKFKPSVAVENFLKPFNEGRKSN